MHSRAPRLLPVLCTAALVVTTLAGCGRPSHGPSLREIAVYPNCSPSESMAVSAPGGLMGGNLQQFTTTDSYDDVVGFYTESLKAMHPEVLTHTSELGRQTAFSIAQKNGVISVAVQEFTAEGAVNITLMGVGG